MATRSLRAATDVLLAAEDVHALASALSSGRHSDRLGGRFVDSSDSHIIELERECAALRAQNRRLKDKLAACKHDS